LKWIEGVSNPFAKQNFLNSTPILFKPLGSRILQNRVTFHCSLRSSKALSFQQQQHRTNNSAACAQRKSIVNFFSNKGKLVTTPYKLRNVPLLGEIIKDFLNNSSEGQAAPHNTLKVTSNAADYNESQSQFSNGGKFFTNTVQIDKCSIAR
jgi:hypothetical protein